MKDEIKKILDRLERIDHKEYIVAFEFADSATFDEMARCFEERKKMADYITNLQDKIKQYEDPEDLTLFHMWLDEKTKDKMKQLQEENKNLKQINEEHRKLNGELRERCAYLERSNNRREDTILGLRQEIYEFEDYKTRNEKAIEYIKSNLIQNDITTQDYINRLNELLEILQGKSDE